jgi:hypothetical protein
VDASPQLEMVHVPSPSIVFVQIKENSAYVLTNQRYPPRPISILLSSRKDLSPKFISPETFENSI